MSCFRLNIQADTGTSGKAAQSVRRAVAAGAQSIWLTVDRQVVSGTRADTLWRPWRRASAYQYRANDQNPKNHRKLYAAEPVSDAPPHLKKLILLHPTQQ